jgi:hypothetical protein
LIAGRVRTLHLDHGGHARGYTTEFENIKGHERFHAQLVGWSDAMRPLGDCKNRDIDMLKIVRRLYAATLIAISILPWIPLLASAQVPSPVLPPPQGGLVVTMTSPDSGSTVTGTVPVSASINSVGSAAVAGVQFRVDGVNLGAEDTSAPYTVSWDTTTADNGSHTLTAVARDMAGMQYASDLITVTVSNATTPPTARPIVRRFEDTDPSVTYTSAWDQDGGRSWSGGTAALSTTPGAQVSFTFTGPSVSWIGARGPQTGIARVSLDGVFVAEVDTFSQTEEIRVPVFAATGLADASHTLTIEVTGRNNENYASKSTIIVADAFDVPASTVSRLQETDPAVIYSADWVQGNTLKAWSAGTASESVTQGARATFTFTGTSISWIGARGPQTGIARVFLDGSFVAEVDTYAPSDQIQAPVFTATSLVDASHTLTIEVTGRKNTASASPLINVDAFDVTSSGTRFQDTDLSVTYSSGWTLGNRDRAYSEGSAAESAAPGARATFTFTGTSVSWIGGRGRITGIARVFLDGVFVDEVDTYSPTEAPQKSVFTLRGLAAGSHTLTIEVTGLKNVASGDIWILIDAFDVVP